MVESGDGRGIPPLGCLSCWRERGTARLNPKAVEANTKLEGQNAALVAAVDTADRARRDAEEARQRAEAAKRKEQRSSRRAIESAEAARAAEADAKRAGEDLERLLAQERKRVKELEEQTRGAQIVPSVKKREVGELK
jgi:colicin import membrane protein